MTKIRLDKNHNPFVTLVVYLGYSDNQECRSVGVWVITHIFFHEIDKDLENDLNLENNLKNDHINDNDLEMTSN